MATIHVHTNTHTRTNTKTDCEASITSEVECVSSSLDLCCETEKIEKSCCNEEKFHLCLSISSVGILLFLSPLISVCSSWLSNTHAAVINYRLPPARWPSIIGTPWRTCLHSSRRLRPGFIIDSGGKSRRQHSDYDYKKQGAGVVWVNERVWNWNTVNVTVLKVQGRVEPLHSQGCGDEW